MGKKTVLDLKVGESGIVKSFNNLDYASKLLTMGILPNSKITVIRKSPFGDALYLQLDGQKLAIRNAEGLAIQLED